MPKNTVYKEALLQLAVQNALGTQATFAATTVLLIENLKEKIKVTDDETLDLVTDNPFYKPTRKTNERSEWGFDVPWIYSGTAGTASVLESVFRVCGLDPTAVVGTDVTYNRAALSAVDAASIRMYADIDGANAYLYQGIDARGQLGTTWEAGKIPRFNITNFLSTYIKPSSEPMITPDFGAQKTNIGENWEGDVAYETTLTIDGTDHSLCMESMSNDNIAAMTIAISPKAGCTKRAEPSNADASTFTVKYKLPDFATEFNPWDLDGKALAVSFGCGSVAGQRIKIGSTSVEPVGEITREEGNDKTTYISQSFKSLVAPTLIEE